MFEIQEVISTNKRFLKEIFFITAQRGTLYQLYIKADQCCCSSETSVRFLQINCDNVVEEQ